jgi:hypothetical protein
LILYIDRAQIQQSVQMYSTIGTGNSLHNTPMGKLNGLPYNPCKLLGVERIEVLG